MAQPLLIPDPRPLVDRLGQIYFRGLPERPGACLMRAAYALALRETKLKTTISCMRAKARRTAPVLFAEESAAPQRMGSPWPFTNERGMP